MELLRIILNSWQLNIIGAVIFSVLYVQSYKLAVKDTEKEGEATIILELSGAVGALLLAPFFAFKFSLTPKIGLLFVLANIFYALNDRLKTIGRKHLEVSIFSIVDQLTKVFMIAYGIILFDNPIIPTKLIGAALIIGGNVALFYRQNKFRFNKYIALTILAAFLAATALIIDADISKDFNLPFYIALTLIIPALFNYIFIRRPVKDIINEFNSKRRGYYIFCGLVTGPMLFFIIRSLQLGQIAITAPLLATSVLLNVLAASIIHKEKSGLFRKIIVALIIIAGVYLTTA